MTAKTIARILSTIIVAATLTVALSTGPDTTPGAVAADPPPDTTTSMAGCVTRTRTWARDHQYDPNTEENTTAIDYLSAWMYKCPGPRYYVTVFRVGYRPADGSRGFSCGGGLISGFDQMYLNWGEVLRVNVPAIDLDCKRDGAYLTIDVRDSQLPSGDFTVGADTEMIFRFGADKPWHLNAVTVPAP